MILITGATGHLGTAVMEHLLKSVNPDEIIALARDESKAAKWKEKGINVQIGDYTNIDSLISAFRGVDKLLLISTNSHDGLREHSNVVEAAKIADVPHIFYTSGALNQQVNPVNPGQMQDSYRLTDDIITGSGLTYTIFQNCLYAETIPFFIGEQVLDNGIFFPAGEGKSAFAKRAEMGEAIANVLTSAGHEGQTYLITGSKSYSFRDILEQLLGRAPVSLKDYLKEVYLK
ncbi:MULTISPECIES: NAD(P)H-binding protein [unclassified Chitinophaga]|uniref:NAD(P)H-binding protein n=1 Tax=unclassified Chitinophaga TaxID=2619133 RepID=UPI00301037C8